MAEIMGAFAHDLDNFVAYYEKQQWDTSFRGEQYPLRCWNCSCTGLCRSERKWRRRRNE